tara:strand:+ start:858 stop:1478 length:621 start_codon:yes stop_codon:yes gene_type:complete
MIAIVDYGLGNVKAFANIYRRLGVPHKVTSLPEELECCDGIILPGVGAFDWAMTRLNQSGFRNCLDHLILEKKRPFLGVCVGMQILANDSEEGQLPGLGWIGGAVKIMSSEKCGGDRILPHMGWNTVSDFSCRGLFAGMEDPEFYFLHSYCFVPEKSEQTLATTLYGDNFVSAVQSENIFGVQFHPEKSHGWGVQLLRNFYEYSVC